MKKSFTLEIQDIKIIQCIRTRKEKNYISRHSHEDWKKSNVASPAFLSRFILWEKPTLQGAITNANNKYKDVKFKLKNI